MLRTLLLTTWAILNQDILLSSLLGPLKKQGTKVPSFKLTQIQDKNTILTPYQTFYIKRPAGKNSIEKQVIFSYGFKRSLI